jgi:hypothetical protein
MIMIIQTKQTNKQTSKQTNKQTNKQTYKQTQSVCFTFVSNTEWREMIPQAFWLWQVLELRFAGDGVIFSDLGFRGLQLILGFLPCSQVRY